MDLNKGRLKTLLIGVLLLLSPIAAEAKDSGAGFGLLYGLTVPDSQNTNPMHLYGVKGTAQLFPVFSVGGYYLVPGQEEGKGGRTFEYSLHGVEFAYRNPGSSGATFVGLRVGLSKLRVQSSGQELILSPYHYGLVTGHDFNVLSWASMGFEGSFLQLERSATSTAGVDYEEDAFNIISFLLTLQVQF